MQLKKKAGAIVKSRTRATKKTRIGVRAKARPRAKANIRTGAGTEAGDNVGEKERWLELTPKQELKLGLQSQS